jgi:DNA-binding NtrC family response regulator
MEHLVSLHAGRLQLEPMSIPGGVVDALLAHPLPGNVRELEQMVLRALIERRWGHVTGVSAVAEAPAIHPRGGEDTPAGVRFGETLPTPDELVSELLREADRRHPGSRSAAAAAVGLSPQAFANRWKRMRPEEDLRTPG